jgi:aldehyde dehydrogenase (NAD+)
MQSKADFNRVLGLLGDPNLDNSQFLTSVFHSAENLRINPILILNPSKKAEIMQNKIYGPILPIVTFEDPFEIQEVINKREHVENLFYFGENSRVFGEIKTLFKYQNLFFNGTNFGVLGGNLGPDYGRDGTMESGLTGRFGFWTFSK